MLRQKDTSQTKVCHEARDTDFTNIDQYSTQIKKSLNMNVCDALRNDRVNVFWSTDSTYHV